MSYTISGLTQYIEVNKDPILRDVVFSNTQMKNASIPSFRKQLGVKTSEKLSYLDVNPVLQAVSGCGFNPQGGAEFTEKTVETAQVKINEEYCIEDLLNRWTAYTVRIGADDQAMPFEAEIVNEIILKVQRQIETEVWQGVKSGSSFVDGLITLAQNDASTITGETATGASAYEAIMTAYNLIPEEIVDEAVIYCSASIFREYCNDLVNKNLFNYSGENGQLEEMWIPASNVRVKKVYGLNGSNYIYATVPENVVYATDFLSNKEELKAWYSDDSDTYRLKMRFNFGIQTLFSDLCVLVEKK